jgi:two-component system, NtrC family, response regulator
MQPSASIPGAACLSGKFSREKRMANVLVIDDDTIFSEMMFEIVSRLGHSVSKAASLKEGFSAALSEPFDVIFLDIMLPDGNGLLMLPKLKETGSSPEIIIMTGFGDVSGAELAIKNGAWDYIQKPSSKKEIQLAFTRAVQYRGEKKTKKPPVALTLNGLIGNSPKMRACFDLVAQAAGTDANVLITGETGTGKELFALAIHNNNSRASKNFVVVDCAALPDTLVESILFGHERGTFTGADRARDGLIKQAHGGTLFLDEVGELPLSLQKSFLRVLQEHRFRPLGAAAEIASDFRLISATNKDLTGMAEQGLFREDLLFRLRTLTIDLPPLRGRQEDIKELLIHYTTKLCEQYGINVKGFSPDFLDAFIAYDWPGNVRELISALEKAIAEASQEPTLFPKHLPVDIRISLKKAEINRVSHVEPPGTARSPLPARVLPTLKQFREEAMGEIERQYLENLMVDTGRNIKEACRISGLSRPRLYALLKQFSLTKNFPQ